MGADSSTTEPSRRHASSKKLPAPMDGSQTARDSRASGARSIRSPKQVPGCAGWWDRSALGGSRTIPSPCGRPGSARGSRDPPGCGGEQSAGVLIERTQRLRAHQRRREQGQHRRRGSAGGTSPRSAARTAVATASTAAHSSWCAPAASTADGGAVSSRWTRARWAGSDGSRRGTQQALGRSAGTVAPGAAQSVQTVGYLLGMHTPRPSFGIAGNVAGHLEQAGEASDFTTVVPSGHAQGHVPHPHSRTRVLPRNPAL